MLIARVADLDQLGSMMYTAKQKPWQVQMRTFDAWCKTDEDGKPESSNTAARRTRSNER